MSQIYRLEKLVSRATYVGFVETAELLSDLSGLVKDETCELLPHNLAITVEVDLTKQLHEPGGHFLLI
jgi:hypothetical protein